MVLATSVALHWFVPLRLTPVTPLRVLGVFVGIAAGVLAIWAQRVMRAAGTHIHPWKPTLALVTDGPFAHTRNPMYTALGLLQLAIGLLIGGVWPAAMSVVVPVALGRIVVVHEERYLTGLIGESYREYCREVPRWGWRWRRLRSVNTLSA